MISDGGTENSINETILEAQGPTENNNKNESRKAWAMYSRVVQFRFMLIFNMVTRLRVRIACRVVSALGNSQICQLSLASVETSGQGGCWKAL